MTDEEHATVCQALAGAGDAVIRAHAALAG
jgi:hypothetical protein